MVCHDTGPFGYVCTRPTGHWGQHVAHADLPERKHELARWGDADAARCEKCGAKYNARTEQHFCGLRDLFRDATIHEITPVMRTFETGATRDGDADKFDYEGFLSPRVLERYARYMHKHRQQADGKLRDSDNWQKGIPRSAYMKSAWRHFMDVWTRWRSGYFDVPETEEALCALLFNVMGMLHETVVPPVTAKDEFERAAEKLDKLPPEAFAPPYGTAP